MLDPDVVRLLALADAIASVASQGEAAMRAVIAAADAAPLVGAADVRTGRNGIWGVTVTLAPGSRVTIDDWNRTEASRAEAPRLPPPPQLVSPSNVPPEAWGELPVYFNFPQPWGTISCEHAHGDAGRRIRRLIVKLKPKPNQRTP